MNFPADLKYTTDHEWIRVEGDVGTIGVTDHAQGELGDVVYVDIPDSSATVAKGDTFGSIEAVKTVADLYAPVSSLEHRGLPRSLQLRSNRRCRPLLR